MLYSCICLSGLYSQESYQILKLDTIQLKKGYILTINNRSYISRKDTALLIPSGFSYKIHKSREEEFIEQIDSSAQYSRLTRELRNMLLVKRKPQVSIDDKSNEKSELSFVEYKNKIIRTVIFKQLDVFGPSLNDTTALPAGWIERTGNKMHIKTRPYLLKNNLLIKKGDLLDPIKLADNERVLREEPYIQDAKILIKKSGQNSDSVDVIIIIKDVWSKAFGFQIDKLYSGNFEFWDRNILGFGNENQNTIYWNSKENPSFGYEGMYGIPNIGGSFIRGKGYYLDKFDLKTYGVSFDRSFYTPNIKYAGGASFFKTSRIDGFNYQDTSIIAPVDFSTGDFWCGRSFSLKSDNQLIPSRRNLTFTIRVTNTYLFSRPQVTENEFYKYQNKTLYLSSITFTKQNFFKSNLIYNYGRTEDIPYGIEAQLYAGYEINEFQNRYYLGTKIAKGIYNDKWGYFYLSAACGGFIRTNNLNQGFITAKLNHFTPLYRYKKFKFRHFVDANYTNGINRNNDEYLTINEKYGLSGFLNDSIRGNQRLNINLETVCFSPWYFYNFRFVFFASAEFSWLSDNKNIFINPVHSGLSLGIRIRNERLVFNTLEIRFYLYPNKPNYSRTNSIAISGEQLLSPESFVTRAPEIPVFR